MTGAPLPEGADAVLPVERVEQEEGQIQALDAVPPGKHVGRIGEDIAADSTVFHSGRRLRPQDLGVLSSIGEGQVQVVRQPRVRIVVTGNELLPPGSSPTGHKIVDANSPMLVALAGWRSGKASRSGTGRTGQDPGGTARRRRCDPGVGRFQRGTGRSRSATACRAWPVSHPRNRNAS